MSRMIFCHCLNKEAPGLERATYPGELGERIYQQISQEAWQNWLRKQTMLINEQHLNLLDPAHRQKLEQAMIGFLFAGEEIVIEGYRPPNEENSPKAP